MAVLDIIKLMRVKQWAKNLCVFVPLILSGCLFQMPKFVDVVISFFAFSLMASAVYVINDLQDVENDRKHPDKCKRPIASGAVSEKQAGILFVVLVLLSLAINMFIYSTVGTIVLFLYLILNLLYSKGLKRIPYLELLLIGLGFVFRVIYGSFSASLEVNYYLFAFILFMCTLTTTGKRLNELIFVKNNTRAVLKKYNERSLKIWALLMFIGTFVSFILWTVDPSVAGLHDSYLLSLSGILVLILGYEFYTLSVKKERFGEVAENKPMLCSLVLLVVIVIVWIYTDFRF